jgi:hypothetical protein
MNIAAILKDLDCSNAIDWHSEFNEAGVAAYEFVSTKLVDGTLTENQRVNLVRCLFRLRFHVSERRAFEEILRFCHSEARTVRSVSVRLASGMIGLVEAGKVPSRTFTPTRKELQTLEEALKLGVDEATYKHALNILLARK